MIIARFFNFTMLKRNLFNLLLYILFYSTTSYTQNLSKSSIVNDSLYLKTFDAYKSGELLEYKLHYGFFNTSYASLEIKEENLNNETVFRATAIGKTIGLARLFFRVDDLYEAFFPLEKVKPIKSAICYFSILFRNAFLEKSDLLKPQFSKIVIHLP